uniref:Uncharacterized protein n=1 Tax=Solanum tuberosum TaxID=4113 RepID=M1DXN0_SOLTU
MQFRGHQENQKEPNALAGTTLVATIEEAMSPILGLTHAYHQQLLLLLGNNGASTEVVSTNTSPLLATSPSPYASSSHDSSAINPSTASNNIDSTVLALGKRSRQVLRKLLGYDYVLPLSFA